MLRIFRYIIILALLIPSLAYGAVNQVSEEDGDPSMFPWKVKVPNGSMTNNLDGTASLSWLTSFTESDPLSLHLSGDNTTGLAINIGTSGTLGAGAITGTSVTDGFWTMDGAGNLTNGLLNLTSSNLTGLSGLSIFGGVGGYSFGYDPDGSGIISTFATYDGSGWDLTPAQVVITSPGGEYGLQNTGTTWFQSDFDAYNIKTDYYYSGTATSNFGWATANVSVMDLTNIGAITASGTISTPMIGDGSVNAIDTVNGYLIFKGGTATAIDWPSSIAYDANAVARIEWDNTPTGRLNDGSGQYSVDWHNRGLYDIYNNIVMDWSSGVSNGIKFSAWFNDAYDCVFLKGYERELLASDSTTVMVNWATNTALQLMPSGGNVLIGTDTDDGVNKLQVNGSGTFSAVNSTSYNDSTGTHNFAEFDEIDTWNIASNVTYTGTVIFDTVSVWFTGAVQIDGEVSAKNVTTTKTIVIDGDLRGLYAVSATKKIPYQENGSGITITSYTVQCSVADPTTELNANIMYCDAQGTGAFPGANPTLLEAIDTTTGNYSSGAVTDSVATGKELYLLIDADPTDLNTMWTITITYTIA